MLKSLKINTSNEKWNEPLRPLQFKTGCSGLFLWLRDFHPTGSSIPTSIRNDLPVELMVFH